MDAPLNAAAIAAALTTTWLGKSVVYYSTISSTNDVLRQETLAHGCVALADYQSRGRGRLDRQWFAPANSSLTFSLLFHPHWPAEQANWLIMIAGLAVVQAVRQQLAIPLGLKWPNDLIAYHEGEWHKVGGILLETEFAADGTLAQAILGIGLNVNIPLAELPPRPQYPASSLAILLGRPVARLPLLAAIMGYLEQWYDAAAMGHTPQPSWNQHLITLGKPVQFTLATQTTLQGTAISTNPWGHLLVQDAQGHIHTISAGDISMPPPPP